MKARSYDIVLFGATGFTGQLVAEYLARHGGERLRWALAGRNPDKLRRVREQLQAINADCRDLQLIAADVDDPAALKKLAASARVVISTVGPYIVHGEPLLAACAETGTDYLDLTGEPEFVDLMWLRHHERARESGARIINSCGFDSVPHDLGCWYTVQQLPEDAALRVQGFVRVGGSFSGGTLHSAVLAMSRLRQYARTRRERRRREAQPLDRRIGSLRHGLRYLRELDSWALPMPTIDPLVVRRSAAALERYGPNFHYGHYLQLKRLSQVAQIVGGAGALMLGAQFRATRERLLHLRSPGQGPSPERRAKSWFKISFIGEGGGQRVRCEVAGGDPGYGETAKMLAESALCLAFDKLPRTAGFVTPAQAMGNALIERLQRQGIRFRLIERS
ncbi:saccharopine dehydrogenase (NAD+, L-glutamate forming) [Solimonas aquatica]|uniref:Saccharopine dehydrogenase (NAD+, L-glutamate forming) n=1 Tax=Solimonas aquatica TaxID=489703 RepID=A0A1H9GUY5_9GAMM|nr:saccharopine dehydrogenase NADP-binding domain-containing protein [Solimonas aquatica]SEQ53884.1 saccharopine dehydrogenase (NAD+, L-glutamate forming) [Solimonas aquatica]